MTLKKIYLYSKWIRFWHIINALCCLVLIVTGIIMHFWSEGSSLISFKNSVITHNIAGIILAINYALYFFGNIFTGNRKHYRTHMKGFIKRIKKQLAYYIFGYFKGRKNPYPLTEDLKFNPIQQFTYKFVMYIITPLIIITGFLLMAPEKVSSKFFGINSLMLLDLLHVIAGFIIILFLIIHIYLSTLGHKPSSHFKAIINGYHEIEN